MGSSPSFGFQFWKYFRVLNRLKLVIVFSLKSDWPKAKQTLLTLLQGLSSCCTSFSLYSDINTRSPSAQWRPPLRMATGPEKTAHNTPDSISTGQHFTLKLPAGRPPPISPLTLPLSLAFYQLSQIFIPSSHPAPSFSTLFKFLFSTLFFSHFFFTLPSFKKKTKNFFPHSIFLNFLSQAFHLVYLRKFLLFPAFFLLINIISKLQCFLPFFGFIFRSSVFNKLFPVCKPSPASL